MVWVGVWNHGGGKIVRTHDNPHKIPSKSGFGPSHGDFTKQGHVWDPGKFLPQRIGGEFHHPKITNPRSLVLLMDPFNDVKLTPLGPWMCLVLSWIYFTSRYCIRIQSKRGFDQLKCWGLRHRKLDQPISLSRAYGLMGIINQLITRGCHLVDIYINIYIYIQAQYLSHIRREKSHHPHGTAAIRRSHIR